MSEGMSKKKTVGENRALVQERITRIYHEGRQKLIYILRDIKHASPL